jgi:hypothetical protein
MLMKNKTATLCCWALTFAAPSLKAAGGFVHILSLFEGARLSGVELNQLVYEADPGPEGDHRRLYVDGKDLTMLLQWRYHHALSGQPMERVIRGYYPLVNLGRGDRTLCNKVVNKSHRPTGIGQCVTVHTE